MKYFRNASKKNYLVTGGGLGRALALRLAEAGAKVIITDSDFSRFG